MAEKAPGPLHYQQCFRVRRDGRTQRSTSFAVVDTNSGISVATVWGHNIPIEQALANARLFVAAPALLALAKVAIEHSKCECDYGPTCLRCGFKRIVDQATGGGT